MSYRLSFSARHPPHQRLESQAPCRPTPDPPRYPAEMQLLSRNTGEPHGGAGAGSQPAAGWASLPRNPVFYPPTLRKGSAPPALLTASRAAAAAAPATSDRRPARLMARIKAALLPRAAAPDPADRVLDLHGPPPDADQWTLREAAPAHPPRLVARSPLREVSISSDLCMLAELGFLPRNARAIQPARAGRRQPNRAALTASVFLPTHTPPTHAYDGGLSDHCQSPLPEDQPQFAPHIGLGQRRQCLTRSTSLMAAPDRLQLQLPPLPPPPPPPPPPLPQQPPPPLRRQKPSIGNYARSHSGSGSSGSTAAPSLAPLASSPSDNEASSMLSGRTRAQRLSFSPSRQTLAAATYACCCGPAEHICPELPLHAPPAAGYDVFDGYEAARRPFSAGFPEHAHFPGGGTGHGAGPCVGLAAFPDAQRAVYMRSSCADSELVRSTFDLAKLLPSAPQ